MKTLLLCGAAFAILGVAATPLSAQTQSTSSTSTTNYIQTSKLIGTKVKAVHGEEVGEIKDVVLDQNGCMAYTVVSTGGTTSRLTGSSKTVAVPWSVYSTTSDPRVVTVRVEKEKIYSAPVFEYSRINEYSTSGYITQVDSYYGVTSRSGAGVSVGGQVSGSTSTTIGTTTAAVGASTTTTTATPAATATVSPIATATASPVATATMTPLGTATPSASASVSTATTPSASPVASASATPSRHTNSGDSASGKAKSGMTPVSTRAHTETTSTTGDSKAESSASKKKSDDASSSEGSPATGKKAHHHAGDGSSSEASATPSEP